MAAAEANDSCQCLSSFCAALASVACYYLNFGALSCTGHSCSSNLNSFFAAAVVDEVDVAIWALGWHTMAPLDHLDESSVNTIVDVVVVV